MTTNPDDRRAQDDAIHDLGATDDLPQLPAVGGDLLARLGRNQEARAEFERAAELTRNARERAVFLGRAASLWTARTCCVP